MENYIMHHGILGQKWGIRRYQNKDGTLTPAGRKRAEELNAEYKKLTGHSADEPAPKHTDTNKDIKEMSDEELNNALSRLKKEQEYKDLLAKKAAEISEAKKDKGKKVVKEVLGDILKSSVKNIGTQIGVQLIGRATNAVAKKFGYQGEFVNPKKGQKDK